MFDMLDLLDTVYDPVILNNFNGPYSMEHRNKETKMYLPAVQKCATKVAALPCLLLAYVFTSK